MLAKFQALKHRFPPLLGHTPRKSRPFNRPRDRSTTLSMCCPPCVPETRLGPPPLGLSTESLLRARQLRDGGLEVPLGGGLALLRGGLGRLLIIEVLGAAAGPNPVRSRSTLLERCLPKKGSRGGDEARGRRPNTTLLRKTPTQRWPRLAQPARPAHKITPSTETRIEMTKQARVDAMPIAGFLMALRTEATGLTPPSR